MLHIAQDPSERGLQAPSTRKDDRDAGVSSFLCEGMTWSEVIVTADRNANIQI